MKNSVYVYAAQQTCLGMMMVNKIGLVTEGMAIPLGRWGSPQRKVSVQQRVSYDLTLLFY